MAQFSSALGFCFDCLFRPLDVPRLTIYYFVWISLFMATNVVWDIKSSKTPDFHIANMPDKISVLHYASVFASSLLILIGLIVPEVGTLAKDSIVPLFMAGGAGILVTIPAICPYSRAVRAALQDGAHRPAGAQPPAG